MTAGTSRFTYEQVAESLRSYIASEGLKPDDRLPPIRALAERFDVSPTTVGNALAHLRDQGLIRSNSTRGYFVSAAGVTVIAQPQFHGQSVTEELDAVRGELRQLTERVARLEGVVRGGASLESSTEH